MKESTCVFRSQIIAVKILKIVISIEQVAQWPLISRITVKTLNFFGFCFNHKLILFVLYELIYERIILFT